MRLIILVLLFFIIFFAVRFILRRLLSPSGSRYRMNKNKPGIDNRNIEDAKFTEIKKEPKEKE
jgi:hypothetical protein